MELKIGARLMSGKGVIMRGFSAGGETTGEIADATMGGLAETTTGEETTGEASAAGEAAGDAATGDATTASDTATGDIATEGSIYI